MKKTILSITVIVLFGLYSIYHRSKTENSMVQTTPTSSPQEHATVTVIPTSPPQEHATVSIAPSPTQSNGKFKNGEYTGDVADAFYGNIQVKVIISNGSISDVQFLQYPNDRETSIEINTQAMPLLKQEAIVAQSSNVDIVSGATDTSHAFQQSLSSALTQAQ